MRPGTRCHIFGLLGTVVLASELEVAVRLDGERTTDGLPVVSYWDPSVVSQYVAGEPNTGMVLA